MKNESDLNKNINKFNSNFPITMTEKAISIALKSLSLEKNNKSILRISVKGGGCAGLKYLLNFVNNNNNDRLDISTKINELNIIIDVFSAIHLNGTTIDYVQSLQESGFKFKNPSAKRTCGCGSSFS